MKIFRNKKIIMSKFKKDLEFLINKNLKENDSNTSDFILANYLKFCLDAFIKRDKLDQFGKDKITDKILDSDLTNK